MYFSNWKPNHIFPAFHAVAGRIKDYNLNFSTKAMKWPRILGPVG